MTTLEEYLKEIARKKAASDDNDFNAYSYSGGKYDDAYYAGCEDGEIVFARELLSKFFDQHHKEGE